MSYPNAVQRVFDAYARDAGLEKKAGSWYRRGQETITVIDLQKSNYGLRYYVNIGVWMLGVEPATFPTENRCHIRTRIDPAVDGFLILTDADDEGDPGGLRRALDVYLRPALAATATLAELRSSRGRRLLRTSLVTPAARALIDG